MIYATPEQTSCGSDKRAWLPARVSPCPVKGAGMQWFRFYSEALDDPKVQRLPGDLFKAWVNLLCLANEQDERGTLPTVDDIAFRLRLDHQKAEDALLGLKRAGLLEVDAETDSYVIHAWDKRQKKSDNVAERVTAHRQRNKQRSQNAPETIPQKPVTLHVTPDPPPSNVLDKNRIEKSREEESRTTPLPPEPRRPDPAPPGGGGPKLNPAPRPTTLNAAQQARFDRWYPTYPNKQHRPEAERAFRKVDPDDALTDRIIDDTAARRQGRKWAEGYIEHPATYLNNRVWEDDIEPVRSVPARASPSGEPESKAQARERRTLEAIWGKQHGQADIQPEPIEARYRVVSRADPGAD